MKRARLCLMLAICLVVVLGFGSTALARPGCPPTPPPIPSYELSADGEGEVQTIYNWTIDKTVETNGDINLSVGESHMVNYAVALTKGEGDTTKEITGTLTMTVNDSDGIDVKWVKAKVHRKHDGDFGEQTLVSDPHYGPGTYIFDYSTPVNHINGEFRIEFEVEIQGSDDKECETSYFSITPQTVNDSVTVQDVMDGSGLPSQVSFVPDPNYQAAGGQVIADESKVIEFQVVFTNDGNKSASSGTFTNTATILELEKSDSTTIDVSVPKVGTTKTKTKTVEVLVTPEPTAAPVEVELPKTGGFIEWEWIALAGGLLTSCGGGLYLIRRRRMKK